MKLLTTLSALALLSACAVHQPDPCLNNNTADCSDRSRPPIERECIGFHCGHPHDNTEGCGVCWPWPGSGPDIARPDPEPEVPTDEPEEPEHDGEDEDEDDEEDEPEREEDDL